MNFLAHSFLSFDDPKLMLGQFIADDIKGKRYLEFEERVQQGILLHRFVDHYTDTHPVCLELRAAIRPDLGLFSSIAIDVIFDHFLSIHWHKYSDHNRNDFIQSMYKSLHGYQSTMNEKRKYLYNKMVEHDWLSRYNTLDGIELTLTQMSNRISGSEKLLKAMEILEKNKKIFEESFEIFFPKLISASKYKLDTFAT
jgi:acyl carrier protein phosphodiesterase